MNTDYLYSDTDWLIYADYLEEQGLTNFVREDVLNTENIPWIHEWRSIGVGVSVGGFGSVGGGVSGSVGGFGFGNNVYAGIGSNIIGVGGVGFGFNVGVGE